MKYFLSILLVFIIFSNCKEEYEPQLSDEQIIEVLVDLHIAEAASMSLGTKIKDSVINVYYPQIFEIHGIQDSLFFKEFEIIRKNPKKLEGIYEKVLEEIDQLGSQRVEEGKENEENPEKKK